MTKPAARTPVEAVPAATGDHARWPVRLWPLVTLVLVTVLALLAWWTGPVSLTAPWDVFILLDGAYRIDLGQVPSTDFENPIGPLVYGLVALGMKVQAVPSLAAVTYGTLGFLAATAPLAWIVARRRLSAVYAAGFTVFMTLLVIATRPLGYSPWTTTYAMLYNRFGWVLYSMLLLLVMLRPAGPLSARRVVVDGLVLGFLLGLMFYCKANFFAAGAVAVVVGFALGTVPRNLRFAFAAAAGFLGVAVAMRFVLGISITGYLGDVVHAGGSQGDQRLGMLVRSVCFTAPAALLAAGILIGMFMRARRTGAPTRPLRDVAVASGFIWVSTGLVAAANTAEHGDLPALVVIPLLLTTVVSRPSGVRTPALALAGVAVLVATAGPIAAKDALSVGHAVSSRDYVAVPPGSQRIASPNLRDFVVPHDAHWQTAYREANMVPEMINNGVELLRRHANPSDTVSTIGLTDPFSFALSLPPSRGGPLWWDVGISFDRSVHPTAEQVFATTDWLMVPRLVDGQGCCAATVTTMLEVYGPYLDEHFTEVESTADWRLLGRKR